MDAEVRAKINALALYAAPGEDAVRSVSASGYTLCDLYDGGLLSAEHMAALAEVADVAAAEGEICSDLRLLDAWLSAFEILASVHASDLRQRLPHREKG